MQIILDTNIVIYGILDDGAHPDCWEILNLVRQQKLIPIISEAVVREYMFAPFEVIMSVIKEQLNNKELTEKFLNDCSNEFYNYSKQVSKLVITNSVQIDVKSNERILSDVEDNKFINISIDSNCGIIITENTNDFLIVKYNDYFTKNGTRIRIMKPTEFLNYFDKQKKIG